MSILNIIGANSEPCLTPRLPLTSIIMALVSNLIVRAVISALSQVLPEHSDDASPSPTALGRRRHHLPTVIDRSHTQSIGGDTVLSTRHH